MDFVVDGRDLVVRNSEGTKLLEAVIAGRGVAQADHRDPDHGTAWSVVVRGDVEVVEVVESAQAYEHARSLHLTPWVADRRPQRTVPGASRQ